MLVLGRIAGVYGVRGWVRIYSDTEPRENILTYTPWFVAGVARQVAEGRVHGKGLVARLAGCDDRDQAAALVGQEIAIRRDQLPPPQPDEFYWADLEGLAVRNLADQDLGTVDHLFATGANDVLVLRGERERLLPFVWGQVIHTVDFEARLIRVDWDADF